jgi:hypothetical protein
MRARFGAEIDDVVAEFLELALQHEQSPQPSLLGVLDFAQRRPQGHPPALLLAGRLMQDRLHVLQHAGPQVGAGEDAIDRGEHVAEGPETVPQAHRGDLEIDAAGRVVNLPAEVDEDLRVSALE